MTILTRSNRALWFAVAGGPIAWSIDALAAISIDHDYCVHGAQRTGTTGIGVTASLVGIALAAAAVASLSGLTGWRHFNGAGPDSGLGDTDDDRRRFMARAGMIISMLTLFGILLRMVTVLFISPATC